MKQFTVTYLNGCGSLRFAFIDAESKSEALSKVLGHVLTMRENDPPLATVAEVTV